MRVGFETQASLVVAAMDLKLVQLIRGAIRAADLSGGKVGPLGTLALERACFRRRLRIEPTPVIEPRFRIEPTPRFEPRPVVHPTPRLALTPAAEPECTPHPKPVVLPPPWRLPVWKTVIPPAPVIKVHIHRTDVVRKGSLVDVFI